MNNYKINFLILIQLLLLTLVLYTFSSEAKEVYSFTKSEVKKLKLNKENNAQRQTSRFFFYTPPKPQTFTVHSAFGNIETLKTPSSQFNNLPDFSYQSKVAKIDGFDMHYIDEGNPYGQVVLLLHGEPTWSFMYRHMIKKLVKKGYRVIAPDLIGFGRSDKPYHQSAHTYARHVFWMTQFIETLNLQNIYLFCQDWGSYIGLRVAAENEHLFAGIVLSNGGLPTGENTPEGFILFKKFVDLFPHFPIDLIMQAGTFSYLDKSTIAAYLAPFPNHHYMAGPDIFDDLVPTSIHDVASQPNRDAWEILKQWEKPFVTIYGSLDLVLGSLGQEFINKVPGAKGYNHKIVTASHFIQEDVPGTLVTVIDKTIKGENKK